MLNKIISKIKLFFEEMELFEESIEALKTDIQRKI